jgi:hypothetical protein
VRNSDASMSNGPSQRCVARRITVSHLERRSPLPGSSSNNAGSSKHWTVIEVIRAAAELQQVCEKQGWGFCFIGGLALQRWGEPRETVDVDLTLLTGFGNERPFVELLLRRH